MKVEQGGVLGLLLIGMVMSGSGNASLTFPELRQRMLALETERKTLTFNYQQEVILDASHERQRFKGQVIVQRPGSLWLRQSAPDEEQIISDGHQVWVYTPRFRQVVVSSLATAMQRMPFLTAVAGWGQALSELERRYHLELELERDNQYVLRCTSREPQDTTRLRFWLSGQDLLPRRSEVDAEGVRIISTFQNLKMTPPIDQKRFHFSVPRGVQVINEF
ncbi:MAG: outer membrane lipoprotein carrier protein LolA [Elusimicrobia bacterium]|nr:outer membrane lipoprotein carrier protein LolA [Elusimicrobiota bacterium]